jgi:hypothetical protein
MKPFGDRGARMMSFIAVSSPLELLYKGPASPFTGWISSEHILRPGGGGTIVELQLRRKEE